MADANEKKVAKRGFLGFFRETKAELKKVIWPSFKQVRNHTGVVIAALILVGAFVAVVDFGFGALVSFLLK